MNKMFKKNAPQWYTHFKNKATEDLKVVVKRKRRWYDRSKDASKFAAAAPETGDEAAAGPEAGDESDAETLPETTREKIEPASGGETETPVSGGETETLTTKAATPLATGAAVSVGYEPENATTPGKLSELVPGSFVTTRSDKRKELYDKLDGRIIQVCARCYKVELLSGPFKGDRRKYRKACVLPVPNRAGIGEFFMSSGGKKLAIDVD